MTCRQTPRRCGAPRPALVVCLRVFSVRRSAGALTFLMAGLRPLRTSWLMVGNENLVVVSRFDCVRRSRPPNGAHGNPVRRPICGLPDGLNRGHTRRRPERGTPKAEYTEGPLVRQPRRVGDRAGQGVGFAGRRTGKQRVSR